MPRKEKIDKKNIFYSLNADSDFVKFLAYQYKKLEDLGNDDIAFEFLRRNPLFIKNSLEMKNRIISLMTEYENYEITEDEFDSIIKKTIDLIRNDFQKVFLYDPVDIIDLYPDIKELEENFLNDRLNEYESNNKKYAYNFIHPITKKSIYVDLYNHKPGSKFAEDDAHIYKQRNSINLELLFTKFSSKRWLKWLRPSINIEINPYQNKDKLREYFNNILSLFNDNEKLKNVNHISAPNHLLDYFDIEPLKNKSLVNKIRNVREPAIKLFFYDVYNILGVKGENSFSHVQTLFEIIFENENFFDYIDLDSNYENVDKNTYTTRLSKKALSYIKEAEKYIFGGYLDIVYPEISIEKHIEDLKDIYDLKFNHNFKSVLDYTNDEYREMNDKCVFLRKLSDKKEILNIVYRSPIDEINFFV